MKYVNSDAGGQDLEETDCGIVGETESEYALKGLECGGLRKRIKS